MNETFQRHLQVGRQFFAVGSYERAASEFEAGLALEPDDNYVRLMLARCWLQLERDDKARCEVEIALKSAPTNPDAHYIASYTARKPKAALVCIDTALGLAPEDGDYHERRAYLLTRLGRYSEALDSARSALEIDPDSPSHHRQIAETLFDEGQFGGLLTSSGLSRAKYEAAFFHVARALELDPNSARSQALAARLKIFDLDYEASMEKWQEALRLDPTDKWAQNELRKAKGQAANARFQEHCWRIFYRWMPWPLRLPLTWGWIGFSFWWGIVRRSGPAPLEGEPLLFIFSFPFGSLMTPLLLRDWLRFVPDRFLDKSLRALKKPPLH